MGVLKLLWTGGQPLSKAFWLYGVLGYCVLRTLRGFVPVMEHSLRRYPIIGSFSFLLLYEMAFIAYLGVVAVGVHRSAAHFEGLRVWRLLAKTIVFVVLLRETYLSLTAFFYAMGWIDLPHIHGHAQR